MEAENPLEKAQMVLRYIQRFKDEYISKWTEISGKGEKAKTQAEAKE